MVDVFRAAARGAGDRRRCDRDRRQSRVDAARHPQRRGRRQGREGRDRGRHEPLPEDRVRPARRRVVMERGQQRHHPQPRRPSRRHASAARSGPRLRAGSHNDELRVRDPRDPCRRRARPGDRRALDADLPDGGLCVRRCRPCRLAVQPAQFRLHLCPAQQPDRFGARRARRQPRRRPRRGRRRLGPCRAIPDLLHLDGAGRRVRRLEQSLWRLADPVRAVVQEARLEMPFCRSGRSGEFPHGVDPADRRRSLSKTSPIPAASSSISKRWRDRARGRASR